MNTFLTKPRMEAPHIDLVGWTICKQIQIPSYLEHHARLGLAYLGIESHAPETKKHPTAETCHLLRAMPGCRCLYRSNQSNEDLARSATFYPTLPCSQKPPKSLQ